MMDQYIGKMLDNRYELLELIGKGGMANVYKAKCHRLNRLVAVKILKSDLAENAEFRRRFRDESLAVAQLSHANIVSVYDVSHSDDLDYIVMELIDGITLKQYMERRGQMDWREALHFITQIMRGLSHAHSRGIIHRDIKPQNIMVLRDGSVKVADFGIACLANASQTLTQEALGSVHYISPEQARGDRTDARSDIYSAGVVLYEMLTGRLPFEGDSAVSVAIQHLSAVPLAPRDINPEVPEGLELITMKAMNPSLDRRYVSADAMLEDLEKFRKDPSLDMGYIRTELNEPPSTEPTQPLPVAEVAAKTGRKRIRAKEQDSLQETDDEDAARDKKRIAIILGGFAAALLLILLLFKLIFSGMGSNSTDSYEVPNVVGFTIEQAMQLPGVKGIFEIKQSGTRVDEEHQPGQILEQDPAEGRTRKGNLVINVVVCVEEEKGEMPNVIGMDYQEAKTQLINMNLDLHISTQSEYSDTQAEGQVIRTDPGTGGELKKGAAVTITYSRGPETKMVKVPSFLGLSLESAIAQAEKAGLRVGQSEYVNSNDPEGAIIGQSLDPQVSVPEDTVIYFTISKGPTMVEVPYVVGMNVNDAVALLQSRGFVVDTAESPVSLDIPKDIVMSQSPDAGVEKPYGSLITIWISPGPQDTPPDGSGDGGGDNGGSDDGGSDDGGSGETEPGTGGQG